jgi:uncharacterized membrane protein
VTGGAGGPPLAAIRAAAATVAAVIALSAALAAGASWAVAPLVAWLAAAVVYLASVWSGVSRLDADATAAKAQSEDSSRAAAEALLLCASLASLVAVAFVLAQAGHAHGGQRVVLVALAVASVVLGWAVVHTVYTLRYARLYYAQPIGGLRFGEDAPPDYFDFAYVAVTIGMTYQVSDTEISKRGIRRALLRHALVSYLFGAVILGVVVSTVASLLNS